MHLIQNNVNHSNLILIEFLDTNYSEFSNKYSITYTTEKMYCEEKTEDDNEVSFFVIES